MSGARKERISDAVQAEVARLLQFEVQDSRLGFVTVTGVEMTGDLRRARVFISLLGDDSRRDQSLDALEAARGFLRKRIGQTLRLKYTPELVFSLDTSIEQGAKIEKLLREGRSAPGSPDDEPENKKEERDR